MAPHPLSLLSLARRAVPKPAYKDPNYKPGGFSVDPTHINSRGFFALFALLGVAMVLAAIWFFFWAKNGGFHFRKGDWDDYKSTVLRRKGPNGTTLSGATKTTKLGGGSVVAEGEYNDYGDEEKIAPWRKAKQAAGGKKGGEGWKRGTKNNEDADVRAYRHEKPARVGGLNRDADGVAGREYAAAYYGTDDLSSNTGSGVSRVDYVPINTPRKKPTQHNPSTPTPKKNGRQSHLYSTPASNASSDSHRPLRPNAAHMDGTGSGASTPTRTPRHSYQPHTTPQNYDSPTRHSRNGGGSMPGSFYTDPLDFESRYTGSEVGTEDSRGTKAYFHPIAGLGSGGGAGGAGQKRTTGGYRRGGEGGWRRGGGGTLSDSD